MNFFFDNNISPRICNALKALVDIDAPYEIVHLRDRFEQSIADADYLNALKGGDWILITYDLGIRKNPINKKAWEEAQLPTFFFQGSFANQDRWVQAWKVIKCWPQMVKKARRMSPGEALRIRTQNLTMEPF